jgi:hypothetical protein
MGVGWQSSVRRDLLKSDVPRWTKHILSDPKVLVGKPYIRGTRVSVEAILLGE